MNSIKSILKFVLNIIELIITPITYKYFVLNNKEDKIEDGNKEDNINLKCNSLKEYYRYKFNQIISSDIFII